MTAFGQHAGLAKRLLPFCVLYYIGLLIWIGYDNYYPDKKTAFGRKVARTNSNPLIRDFYYGKYRAGTPISELIAAYPNCHIFEFDGFTRLDYNPPLCFEGIGIVAKDGKLASAGLFSCSFGVIIFRFTFSSGKIKNVTATDFILPWFDRSKSGGKPVSHWQMSAMAVWKGF